jgi:hypothetical protein
MFNKKKAQEKEKREKKKMIRKVLGKDPGRRVFGFQCSPNIQASLKSLSDQMHIPLFALAEHALQLGTMQLVDANNNPDEREVLRRHLAEDHVAKRTIEKVARYDTEASNDLKIERIRRFDIDKSARQLVIKFMRWGHKPEELEDLIIFGHRCKLAIALGWSPPPGISPRSFPARLTDTEKKHDTNDSENISSK